MFKMFLLLRYLQCVHEISILTWKLTVVKNLVGGQSNILSMLLPFGILLTSYNYSFVLFILLIVLN